MHHSEAPPLQVSTELFSFLTLANTTPVRNSHRRRQCSLQLELPVFGALALVHATPTTDEWMVHKTREETREEIRETIFGICFPSRCHFNS